MNIYVRQDRFFFYGGLCLLAYFCAVCLHLLVTIPEGVIRGTTSQAIAMMTLFPAMLFGCLGLLLSTDDGCKCRTVSIPTGIKTAAGWIEWMSNNRETVVGFMLTVWIFPTLWCCCKSEEAYENGNRSASWMWFFATIPTCCMNVGALVLFFAAVLPVWAVAPAVLLIGFACIASLTN